MNSKAALTMELAQPIYMVTEKTKSWGQRYSLTMVNSLPRPFPVDTTWTVSNGTKLRRGFDGIYGQLGLGLI
jgi:hypothetical protein